MGNAALDRALSIAQSLRRQGLRCYVDYSGASLKSQLRLANKLSARHVLILGEKEIARDVYQMRRMKDSRQWDISPTELGSYLKSAQSEVQAP
jgi:histidyl-tRNA synthetase